MTFLRIIGLYHSLVLKVVPGQSKTNLWDYQVYDYYSQSKPMTIGEVMASEAYYKDPRNPYRIEDVSHLVPGSGWRPYPKDAKLPRKDNLAVVERGSNLLLSNIVSDKPGLLDWSDAGAYLLVDQCVISGGIVKGASGSGIRSLGVGNVIEGVTLIDCATRCHDLGFIYQSGRRRAGAMALEDNKWLEIKDADLTLLNGACIGGPAEEPIDWYVDGKKRSTGPDGLPKSGVHIDDYSGLVTIRNWTFRNLPVGLNVNGGKGIRLENCTFENCGMDIKVANGGEVSYDDRNRFDGKKIPRRLVPNASTVRQAA